MVSLDAFHASALAIAGAATLDAENEPVELVANETFQIGEQRAISFGVHTPEWFYFGACFYFISKYYTTQFMATQLESPYHFEKIVR